MAEFRVSVGEKEYIMEYTRDSMRQFEALGGSLSTMQEKIYTSLDQLFYIGLMKHQPGINYNLAKKIADTAIDEYGAGEIYTVLAEKFVDVFTQEGSSEKKKSFLISDVKVKK